MSGFTPGHGAAWGLGVGRGEGWGKALLFYSSLKASCKLNVLADINIFFVKVPKRKTIGVEIC